MADAPEFFSTQSLFADKSVAAGFQRFLGVHPDGSVGSITRHAINQRFGGSSENHEVRSEAIIGLQRQLGLPETGLVDRNMIEAFDKKFQNYQGPTASAQIPPAATGRSTGRMRSLSGSVDTHAQPPEPRVNTQTSVEPSTTARLFGYSIPGHDPELRYIANVDGRVVTSRVFKKVNGEFVPATINPEVKKSMDDYMAKNADRLAHMTSVPAETTNQKLALQSMSPMQIALDPRVSLPARPDGMVTASVNAEIKFYEEWKKAGARGENVKFMSDHPGAMISMINDRPESFTTFYTHDDAIRKAVDGYRATHTANDPVCQAIEQAFRGNQPTASAKTVPGSLMAFGAPGR